jgi:hemolysin activation/secretion protein
MNKTMGRRRMPVKGMGLPARTALAMALAAAAGAATATTPGQVVEEGLRRQEERTQALQRDNEPRADALSPAATAQSALDLPQEERCFEIDRIELEGERLERLRWLTASLQAYTGRCIGVEGLRRIVARADDELLRNGYATTRASLPAQNLASGTLRLHVDVGRLGEIRMVQADGSPDTRWGTWRNSFLLRADDILDVRSIEQGVEQMKRVPTQTVTTRIEPGAAPGTSDLVVQRDVEQGWRRLRGGLTLDNSGTMPMGRTQLSGNLAFDNPAGLSDILSVQFSSNAEELAHDHRSQSGAIEYGVPLGYSTFSLGRSHNRFAQNVPLTTTTVLSSGWSDSTTLGWDDIVLRSAAWKFGVEAKVQSRRARSFLDDTENVVQHRATTSFEQGLTYRLLASDTGVLDLAASLRRGVPWLNAEADYAQAPNGLTLRPHIAETTASYADSLRLGGRVLQWSTSVHVQRAGAGETTLSTDQIAIGGRGSVRGFSGDRVLVAESGWILRNDASTPVRLVEGVDTAVYLAVDAGRVWGPSAAQLVGHGLAGTAVGVRGQAGRVQFDVALAGPLRRPPGFEAPDLVPYLALTVAF